MIHTRYIHGIRSAMALVIALLLLAPCLNGFVFLAAGDSSCTMTCCKAAKACHRSGHGGAGHAPAWSSAPQCPKGCGQLTSIAGPAADSLAAVEFNVAPGLTSIRLAHSAQTARAHLGAEFALFGRPPPAFVS